MRINARQEACLASKWEAKNSWWCFPSMVIAGPVIAGFFGMAGGFMHLLNECIIYPHGLVIHLLAVLIGLGTVLFCITRIPDCACRACLFLGEACRYELGITDGSQLNEGTKRGLDLL